MTIWISEDLNAREVEILKGIRRYLEDYRCDTHSEGYDEGYQDGEDHAWDEARNKGYDEGWEDACQYILDTWVSKTGFIVTPETIEQMHDIIEYQPNIAAAAVLNFLHKKISNMKVDK